jgi:ribosome biogenesis GTPase / thiamine phosphate phosphatase
MHLHSAFDALARIGFRHAHALALSRLEIDGVVARVVAVHRDRVELDDGAQAFGAGLVPELATALRDNGDSVVVGDWCLWDGATGGTPRVIALAPRETLIARGRGHGRQPLVANADTALLLMGLDDNFSPNRIERFLLLARGAGVMPVVVLGKADLCTDAPAREAEICALAGRSTPVLSGDLRDPRMRLALAPWLDTGQTLVMLGSSGVGKSTLANTLLGSEAQATGAVSALGARGRHTTVVRRVLRLPDGACLIDTPGLRELQLAGDEVLGNGAFADIAALSRDCRYSDCRHDAEPGCAVRGQVDPARLANFHKLARELAQVQRNPIQQREQRQHDKQRQRALRRLYRDRDADR